MIPLAETSRTRTGTERESGLGVARGQAGGATGREGLGSGSPLGKERSCSDVLGCGGTAVGTYFVLMTCSREHKYFYLK